MSTTGDKWFHLALEYRASLESTLRDAGIMAGLMTDHHPGHGAESQQIVQFLLRTLDDAIFARNDEAKRLAAEFDALIADDRMAANPPAPPPSDTELGDICRRLARDFDRRAAAGMEGAADE